MFTIEEREYVRDRVLTLAKSDLRVTAGALTGSKAVDAEDARSDIDVAFGIADGISLEAVLDDWTEVLGREFGVLHHWDLHSGSSIYRVFLLPSGLEVDVGYRRNRNSALVVRAFAPYSAPPAKWSLRRNQTPSTSSDLAGTTSSTPGRPLSAASRGGPNTGSVRFAIRRSHSHVFALVRRPSTGAALTSFLPV